MKTLKCTALILVCLININVYGTNGTKRIFFVHGMGGDGGSLERIRWHIYFINSPKKYSKLQIERPFNYESYTGIDSSALQVSQDILAADLFYNSTDIVIAHSMGGLVARKLFMDVKQQGKTAYGGIITLSTPHAGAGIAHRIIHNPGAFNAFMKNSIAITTLGPKNDELGTLFAITNKSRELSMAQRIAQIANPAIKVINEALKYTMEALIGAAIDKLVQTILQVNFEKMVTDNVAESREVLVDLAINSEVINEINSYNGMNNIPKIAIWGNETNPSAIRLISASEFSKDLINKRSLFSDTGDQTFVDLLNKIAERYKTQERFNNDKAKKWYTLNKEKYRLRASYWKQGASYLQYDLNMGMLREMGCTYQKRLKRCTNRCWDYSNTRLVDCREGERPDRVDCRYYYVTMLYPNDGLLPQSTQTAFPGAFAIKLDNINHEEMKTNIESGRTIERILKGTQLGMPNNSKPIFRVYN
jgi:hypothetical protein